MYVNYFQKFILVKLLCKRVKGITWLGSNVVWAFSGWVFSVGRSVVGRSVVGRSVGDPS